MTGRRILVVEDEEAIAEAVRARLASEGYHVEVAHDGPEALRAAGTEPPDLVVLDLMLPGMDGLEVCQELQRSDWVPVLMLTARTEEADKVAGFAVGADDYLTKPFSLRELAARVRAILRRMDRIQQTDPTEPVTRFDLSIDPARRRITRGYRDYAGGRVVDSHVARVRRKLGEEAAEPKYIRTVHGVGYAFQEEGREMAEGVR